MGNHHRYLVKVLGEDLEFEDFSSNVSHLCDSCGKPEEFIKKIIDSEFYGEYWVYPPSYSLI